MKRLKQVVKYICIAGLIIVGLMSIIATGGVSSRSVSAISGAGK